MMCPDPALNLLLTCALPSISRLFLYCLPFFNIAPALENHAGAAISYGQQHTQHGAAI